MKLDELVQLHEEITIVYMVTDYEATLSTSEKDVFIARGSSILEALIALEKAAEQSGKTLKQIRGVPNETKILSRAVILQKLASARGEVESYKSMAADAGDRRDSDALDHAEEMLAKAVARAVLLEDLATYKD